jgi:hypothetical protein
VVSFTPLPLYADLDDMEKLKFFTLPRLELLPLGRQARIQSLYRLRYPPIISSIDINRIIQVVILIVSLIVIIIVLYTKIRIQVFKYDVALLSC